MINSRSSARSLSEYRWLGPDGSEAGVSRTDLVNSGLYFFIALVVILGITILPGFGGSFFNTGFIAGLIETKDFGSNTDVFFANGFTSGAGFETTCFVTCLALFLGSG